jgi:hypothetical protein
MVTVIWLASKLESKDLAAILKDLVNSNLFAILGWLMFLIAVSIGLFAFNYREKIYQNELNRLQQVKDRVVQSQLEIKFPPT